MKSVLVLLLLVSAEATLGKTVPTDREITILAKKGHFEPAKVTIAENEVIRLVVENQTENEVEFESYKLNKEEKIKPGEKKTIFLRGLKKGSYPFFDDKDEDVKGEVTVN